MEYDKDKDNDNDNDKYRYRFSPNMHFKKGINNNNLLDFKIDLKSK
jgi:hypothetical protein